jgi:hypothetical protein
MLDVVRKGLLCGSIESVFDSAKFYICESSMLHSLEDGEWCLRRCAELGDDRSVRILEIYEETGDLVSAFKM